MTLIALHLHVMLDSVVLAIIMLKEIIVMKTLAHKILTVFLKLATVVFVLSVIIRPPIKPSVSVILTLVPKTVIV